MSNQAGRPRVILFGMQGTFSPLALLALLESEVEVCGIIMPSTSIAGRQSAVLQRKEPPLHGRAPLPLVDAAQPPSLVQLAWSRRIPVWEVQRLSHPDVVSAIAAYQADALCVACFPSRIPRAILALPRLGCLNVHPSLLPANRGPVPLFWTFREGHTLSGVTIHLMDEGMDSGDIVAQEVIAVPEGISYAQLEALCARAGGALLARCVWALYQGTACCEPQEEAKSSYRSFPSYEDFIIHPELWDARHVYNFVSGVGHWDEPIEIRLPGSSIFVREVRAYTYEPPAAPLQARENEKTLWVQCRTGWVLVCVRAGDAY